MSNLIRARALAVLAVFLFLPALVPLLARAEIPQKIGYQGYLTDASGAPVNGTVNIVFGIYGVASGGRPLWSETHENVAVSGGVHNAVLGEKSPIDLKFDIPYYLGVAVNSDPEMTPRKALTSTGYAFRASEVDVLPAHPHSGADITSGTVTDARIDPAIARDSEVAAAIGAHAATASAHHTRYTDAEAVAAVLAADGPGSGLNADLLDGQDSSAFSLASHNHDAAYVNANGDVINGILYISQTGTNGALDVRIDNGASAASAIYATSNGSGRAISAVNTGSGEAGYFRSYGSQAAVKAISDVADAVYAANSGSGGIAGFFISSHATGSAALMARSEGTAWAGVFDGDVRIYGNLVKDSGSFVQPHPSDPAKELVYAFFEGPEHAIFLRGTAKLINGRTLIETPEYFRVVAGVEGITVQFTPRSLESKGLAAHSVTREKIEVGELLGGKGIYEFDYFITAKRAGFERHEPIQPNRHFSADMKTMEEFEGRYRKTEDITARAMRNLLIANGILNPEGNLNMETVKKLGWTIKETDLARRK